MTDPMLTAADIARHLSVPYPTVYGWVREGSMPLPARTQRLPAYTRRWWTQSAIDRWWAAWPWNPANRPQPVAAGRQGLSDWEGLA